MRRGKVMMHGAWAGDILEDERTYRFMYRPEYLNRTNAQAVSATLP